MSRIVVALALAWVAASASAQARVEGGVVADRWWGGAEVTLELSAGAPWRLALLDDPPRLALEVEAAWEGAPRVAGDNAGPAAVTGAGAWSRLELTLPGPMEVAEAGLAVGEAGAQLRVVLAPTDAETFAALVVPAAAMAEVPPPPADDGRLVVALDPGHGGLDPGAERDGVRESALMLDLARELAQALEATGIAVALTRKEDAFVPLQERMTRARAAGADALVSLHADALEADEAAGASVYTLAPGAGDAASRRLAERHGGGDLIGGLDLAGQGTDVAEALLGVARGETAPASRRLAEAMVAALSARGVAVNGRPLREGELAVLAAADFPSVLVETGFLSDEADRARLSSPAGRAPLVAALAAALAGWAAAEGLR